MSSQSSANAPVLYEDRTLFPQPIQDHEKEPPTPPPRAGLSAVGVLAVAAVAAGIAGAVVWFASQTMDGSTGGPTEPDPVIAELRAENARLAKVIADIEEGQEQAQIEAYETRIDDLEAQVENFGSYGRLAELEQQIAARKADIERLIAQPERQRMPASAKAIPEPESDISWVSRVEDELEEYLETLEDRVEWVASWPARNPPPPCADPENC
ncbi:MAG: hypothetical protein VX593_06290 [Pseudomonadota bacterium]|nr:hypothetical protein [Pseudomonadota bacterium]